MKRMDWGFGVLARGAGLASVIIFAVWVAGTALVVISTDKGITIGGLSQFTALAIWSSVIVFAMLGVLSVQLTGAGKKYVEYLENEELRRQGKL